MKHTISALVENKFGVLARVAGMFSGRGFNIETLNVGPVCGGIGLQLVKQNKRTFKPNVQRVRVRTASGAVKRLWVCAKAIKAGLVEKAS